MGSFSNIFGGDDARAIEESGRLQADAIREATALQRRQQAQTREDFTPFREAGARGVNALQALLLDGQGFRESPDYRFRVGEGVKALERGAAARGRTLSGAQGRALTSFGQQAGSQEFGSRVNRLAALSGLGLNAASAGASHGAASTNALAGLTANLGQTRGNAVLDAQGARNNALGRIGSAFGTAAGGILGADMDRNSLQSKLLGSVF